MIKTLQRKFIAIAMLSVVLVLSIIMIAINLANYRNVMKNADARLDALVLGGGSFDDYRAKWRDNTMPPEIPSEEEQMLPTDREDAPFVRDFRARLTEETPFNTRYFTVTLDENGAVTGTNLTHIAAINETAATSLATGLFAANKTEGLRGSYKYRTTVTDDGCMYIFLDCSDDLASFRIFLYISIAVSVLGAALVFVLVLFFSRVAVKPIAESYEKQKRFITDASHEIKTPLAIIDANTEVIELENGESEWTDSIKRQIKRLTSLTEKLVFLSRMEEEGTHTNPTDFSLSEAVEDTAESFRAVAEAKEKSLSISVAPEINYHGDEAMLRQMVSLLIDNAMKYSNEHGHIFVTLEKPGKHPVLTVKNTVDEIEKGNLNMLFERFYRKDASRSSKTGGHGIGLSVVQAIVLSHKGKITAESPDGKTVLFTAVL